MRGEHWLLGHFLEAASQTLADIGIYDAPIAGFKPGSRIILLAHCSERGRIAGAGEVDVEATVSRLKEGSATTEDIALAKMVRRTWQGKIDGPKMDQYKEDASQ